MVDLSNNIVAKAIIGATNNPFRHKDARKFQHITKFIGQGSVNSSTNKYAKALYPIANTGIYTCDDFVGISVEGNRANRKPFNKQEVDLAIKAKATIVTDTVFDRERTYNMGERALAAYLRLNNYAEKAKSGLWQPIV